MQPVDDLEEPMALERYACPCCGNLTMTERPPGTLLICAVCYWEDDRTQFEDPTNDGGANRVSLNDARANYVTFGASQREFAERVRAPEPRERPEL